MRDHALMGFRAAQDYPRQGVLSGVILDLWLSHRCCLSRYVAHACHGIWRFSGHWTGSQKLSCDHCKACKSPEYTASVASAITAMISVAFDRTPDYVIRSTPNNVINDTQSGCCEGLPGSLMGTPKVAGREGAVPEPGGGVWQPCRYDASRSGRAV